MMPNGTSATPPATSAPAYEAGTPAGPPVDRTVTELRKSLGLPLDQPVPESVMAQALMGKRGPQAKQLAETIGSGGTFKADPNAPLPGAGAPPTPGGPSPTQAGADSPNGVPSAPDEGQAGGQAIPPSPNGPDLANGPNIMPGNNPAKVGSRTIFGRNTMNATGEQNGADQSGNTMDDVDGPDGVPVRAKQMFGRR